MRTLYTGGTFDLLHFGHFSFLRQCAALADRVVVALNTDEFILEFKNQAPVLTYDERKEGLLRCQYVSAVVENIGGRDSRPAIEEVSPDIIAIGDDWAAKNYYAQMGFTPEWLEDHGITLVYLPYTQGISSSEIKRRIGGLLNK